MPIKPLHELQSGKSVSLLEAPEYIIMFEFIIRDMEKFQVYIFVTLNWRVKDYQQVFLQ